MNLINRWFITDDFEIRYAHSLISVNEYDDATTFLVVSMQNNFNRPCRSNSKLEEINKNNFYPTLKDAQIELLIKERFYNDKR